ncbi:MAG TPA: hypothetical protein VEX86_14390 [Longimicrobium sp.]|nr:hypothetical protein [Longimicrobium sp.]
MTTRKLRRDAVGLLGLAMVLVAGACTPPGTMALPSPRPVSLDSLFQLAIDDAAVYRADHVLPLNAAVPDGNGNVRVVTFTSYAGYTAGTDTVTRDTWVTLVPEVSDSCNGFTGDLKLRLNQLLGLPPHAGDSLMVEMTVPASRLFRPVADPAITTRYPCGDTLQAGCGESFPVAVSPEHVRWIADNLLTKWQDPNGYPWTRLGYTYNWHPGSPRYGASEYLVRRETVATGVTVQNVRAYCGRGS